MEPSGNDGKPASPGLGLGVKTSAAFGFVVALLASSITFTLAGNQKPHDTVQPIAFNHKKHVEQEQLGCTECHTTVEKEAFPTVPTVDDCAMCHSEAQGKSEEEKRLLKAIQSGEPLRWQPLFRQPSHIYFSHRRHVVSGGIECTVCHGNIAATDRPPLRVKKLVMGDCIACHKRHDASIDCTACHR